MKQSALIWLALLLVVFSNGCSPIIRPEQAAVFDSLPLEVDQSLGQSFVARFDGMNGVEIYLEPLESGNGEIQLTLRDNVQGQKLGRGTVPIAKVTSPGYYRFSLPVQPDSNRQAYYLSLKIKGSGRVNIGAAPGNTYLNGALYRNGSPDDAHQMAFQLSYHPPRLALGLAGEFLTWGWYLLVAAFLFMVPGWAMLEWTGIIRREYDEHGAWSVEGEAKTGKAVLLEDGKSKLKAQETSIPPQERDTASACLTMRNWPIQLALAAGVGLAIYPVLMAFTNAFGFQLGALYAWSPPLIGLLIILWHRRKSLKSPQLPKVRLSWANLTFIAILAIVFIARFWTIRTVPVPLWGDSLQHAVITQLILDNGGIFSSWQPYTPYYSLTSHFGFSAFAALFAWVTGMDGTQATLWVGQILNGLAILTLYPLGLKISRGNRWAGIGTLLAGGLVFSLPAVYVNWGRYAQLSGQVILPIALWLLWRTLDNGQWSLKRDGPRLFLTGMAITGMTLSYYRMPFYFGTFVLVLLLLWGTPKWRFNLKLWGIALLRILLIGLICLLLFLPWGLRLTGSHLATALGAGVSTSTPTTQIVSDFITLKTATNYFPPLSLLISGIALILALLRKYWMVAGLPLWFALLLGYRVGAIFKLPGANMLQVFAVMIAFYIPLGLLIGWLFGEAVNFIIANITHQWLGGAVSLLVILTAIGIGWQQRLILDMPRYALVTTPDLKAFDWIKSQTPPDSQFLVQGFEYANTVAGSDAGWWIPLLAHRSNTIPPQYAQFNETPQPPGYTQRVVELTTLLQEQGITAPKSIATLCAWEITHVYYGQGQGRVGGPGPLYTLDTLQSAPDLFTPIYRQDRVAIFTLNPTACSPAP